MSRIKEINEEMTILIEERSSLIKEQHKNNKIAKQNMTFKDKSDKIEPLHWYEDAKKSLIEIINSLYGGDTAIRFNNKEDKLLLIDKSFFANKYLPFVVQSIGSRAIKNMSEVRGQNTRRAANVSRNFYAKFNKKDILEMVREHDLSI